MKTETAKHTAWHLRETTGQGYTVHDQNDNVVFDHVFEPSEHKVILEAVRAVNAHEELLRAANTALLVLKEIGGWTLSREILEAAIAKAEGK